MVFGGRAVRVLAAAGALVLLSSCIKADVDLTVRSDDVVDGTIVMAVDRSFAGDDAQTRTALVSGLRGRVLPATRFGARQEDYSDRRYVGTRIVIEHMTLSDLDRSTGDNGLKIVHQGSRIKLSGEVDTTQLTSIAATSSPQDAQRLKDSYEVLIRVTFPGRVISSNGIVTDHTVTWRPRLGQRLDLAAQSEDADVPWLGAWLVVAGVVLAAAAAAALFRYRPWRRRSGR
jgi:LppM domain